MRSQLAALRIDPTARQGADLGLNPIVTQDACGVGEPEAGSVLSEHCLHGQSILTDTAAFCAALHRDVGSS
jgi:nicotinamidase-related amidase